VKRLLVAACLLIASALPAAAGELAFEAQVGYFDMNAQHTAKALFGSSGGATFGGGIRYTVWKGVFVSAGMRSFSKDGERVFLNSPGGVIQPLGFPVSVQLKPILLSAGYRYVHWKWAVPYASVGAAITSYSEKSNVAGQTFDEDFSRTGLILAGGVEVGHGLLRGGIEAGYSTVSSAVGFGGVSKVYGEDDIGGFHVVGKVVVAFELGQSKKKRRPVRPTFPKP
jgi:Outer membrane protein beta-barrel domain